MHAILLKVLETYVVITILLLFLTLFMMRRNGGPSVFALVVVLWPIMLVDKLIWHRQILHNGSSWN